MQLRLALAALALALPATMTPAHADVAIATGDGWISPGVPTPSGPCLEHAHFEITGSATNLGTTFGPGPYDFLVTGDSAGCASFTSDTGSATIQGDVTGVLQYSRSVAVIQLSGLVSVQGSTTVPVDITCQVVIRKVQPVTDFTVVCAVTI